MSEWSKGSHFPDLIWITAPASFDGIIDFKRVWEAGPTKTKYTVRRGREA